MADLMRARDVIRADLEQSGQLTAPGPRRSYASFSKD
jgi:hypothetical protein